jgi:hypothetical protein
VEAYREAKKSEAQRNEEARLTAISYRTVIADPVTAMAAVYGGQVSPAEIVAHMDDFPDFNLGGRL